MRTVGGLDLRGSGGLKGGRRRRLEKDRGGIGRGRMVNMRRVGESGGSGGGGGGGGGGGIVERCGIHGGKRWDGERRGRRRRLKGVGPLYSDDLCF